MATLTIRNLDDALKSKLRIRAATLGHSMEGEARLILGRALSGETVPEVHLVDSIRKCFAPLGGVELPEVTRESGREPPDFAK